MCLSVRELRKWWAQYMESTSEMETALQFYEAARDNLSLVRVYCYCGNLEKVRSNSMKTRLLSRLLLEEVMFHTVFLTSRSARCFAPLL